MCIPIAVILYVSTVAFTDSAAAPLVGHLNRQGEMLLRVDALGLLPEVDLQLCDFAGKPCGKVIGKLKGGLIHFQVDAGSGQATFVLNAKSGKEERNFIVQAVQSTGGDWFEQMGDRILIAAITLFSSVVGFVLQRLFEDRRSDLQARELFKMNLESIAIDLRAGSNLAACLSRDRLIPNELVPVIRKNLVLYERLLLLAADVGKFTEREMSSKRAETVRRFFEAVDHVISIGRD